MSVSFRLLEYIAVVSIMLLAPSAYAAECMDGVRLPDFAGKPIVLRDDTLLFSTNILKIDIDGSGRSYGVHDQGAEHICNGLSAAEPKKCRDVAQRGECFTACEASFRRWHAQGGDPADLGRFMRSIGLGGANGSMPKVRLQAAPNQDYFVSHTSVRYGPWRLGEPTDAIDRQEAQVEPFEVPFFVISREFRRLPWDATPGDVGVIVNANVPDRPVLFVVGDVGGKLDEGSAKLQEMLRGRPLVPLSKRNALGKTVNRYGDLSYEREGGNAVDLRVAIFRHTSTFDPDISGSRIVLQSISGQEEMLKFIEDRAGARLAAFGGVEKVIACTQ